MVSCAACGCSKTSKNTSLGITFHHFPKDENLKKNWLKVVEKENWTLKKNSVLCSQHFSSDCFDRTSKLKIRLFPNSVPTNEVNRLRYVRNFNLVDIKPMDNLLQSSSCEVSKHSDNVISPSCDSRKRKFSLEPAYVKVQLKKKISKLQKETSLKTHQIKILQRLSWRQKKTISSLKAISEELIENGPNNVIITKILKKGQKRENIKMDMDDLTSSLTSEEFPEMDLEDLRNSLNIEDFPNICRICLTRSDLKNFEQYQYLVDMFKLITNIDITFDNILPKNICSRCVLRLDQICEFIESSKNTEEILQSVIESDIKIGSNVFFHTEIDVDNSSLTDESKYKDIITVFPNEDFVEPTLNKAKLIVINEDGKTEEICIVSTNESDNSFENDDDDINEQELIKCEFCNEEFRSVIVKNIHLDQHFNENIVDCSICDKNLETKEDYFDHIKIHQTNQNDDKCECLKEFKWTAHEKLLNSVPQCKKCQKVYKSREKMELEESNTENIYRCSECFMIFDLKDKLTEHERLHEFDVFDELTCYEDPSSGRIFKCDQCSKTFDWYYKLKVHQKTHLKQHKNIKRLIECRNCSKTFRTKNNLKVHMRSHTGERPFKCGECPKTFRYLANFNIHKHVHSNLRPYKCTVCSQSFRQRYQLKKHSIFHAGPPKFMCEICSKSFYLMEKLNRHKLTHLDEKDKLFKCDYCFRPYATQSLLNKHVHDSHLKERFQCDMCPQSFIRRFGLLLHKKNRHSSSNNDSTKIYEPPEPPYTSCPICEKPFITKNEYYIHIELHKPENIFECNFCFKRFDHKYKLTAHKRLHNLEVQETCPICQKSFKYRNYLIIHLRSHSNERPFKCPICPKRFLQRRALLDHSSIHNNHKPYKCTICLKSFRLKNHLQKHQVYHEGPPKFICEICSKAFYSIGPLNKHKLTHLDEQDKRFRCDQCFKAFASMPKLTEHLKLTHSEPKFQCDICLKMFKRNMNLVNHKKRFHLSDKKNFNPDEISDGSVDKSNDSDIVK